MTPPASAEPPTMPSARPLPPRGNRSPTTAIAIGSIAPAPTAWKTLMPIRNGRLGERAATAEHSMKNTVATANIRRWPKASDMLPISGMAAT